MIQRHDAKTVAEHQKQPTVTPSRTRTPTSTNGNWNTIVDAKSLGVIVLPVSWAVTGCVLGHCDCEVWMVMFPDMVFL